MGFYTFKKTQTIAKVFLDNKQKEKWKGLFITQ